MLHRRPTALVAVLLPLAAALTSCGFDYPTDRVNTIAAGVNEREASVDVLGARILAYSDGQGRLIGTLVYNENDAEDPAVLEVVEGAEHGISVEPQVEVPGNASVNLAGDDAAPVAVTGDFTAGDVVPLTYQFSTGEAVSLEVPVVKACGQYAGIEEPSPHDTAATDATAAAEDEEHSEEEGHGEESDATYLCEHPTEAAEEEGGH